MKRGFTVFSLLLFVLFFSADEGFTAEKASKGKRKPSSLEYNRCFQVNVEAVDSLQSLLVHWPRSSSSRSFYIFFNAVDTEGHNWINGFNCTPRAKFYDCVGHDDSGQFKILKPLSPFKMKVRFFSMGDPDNPGPTVNAPSEESYLDLEGTSAGCPRP